MFTSATDEISHWADRCRLWARGARTSEQRKTLQLWERLLRQAAVDAQNNLEWSYVSGTGTHSDAL